MYVCQSSIDYVVMTALYIDIILMLIDIVVMQ